MSGDEDRGRTVKDLKFIWMEHKAVKVEERKEHEAEEIILQTSMHIQVARAVS